MHGHWRSLLAAALIAPGLALAGPARAQALPAEVAQALAQAGVPESSVAVLVVPLAPPAAAPGQGRPPAVAPRLAWQAEVPMNPASVMKLVTTYAGLDLLGPEYFWKTRVFAQGPVEDGVLRGNLAIRGGGDPKLVRERLAELIDAIRARGIQTIAGDILLDRSVFELPPHDPAAFDDEPLRPYNVGPDGLLINFKALVLRLIPDPAHRRARVEVEPPMAGVDVPASVSGAKGSCGQWRAQLAADFSQPERVRLGGQFPLRCGEREWAVAYPDPDGYAPRVIEAMWRAAGGSLAGRVRWADQPADGQPLVTGYSLPLAEIIRDINLHSNNVMAQQLFLSLSAREGARASFAESGKVLQRWWQERFGQRPAPLVDNGSGLSREGRVSAASLVALLQQAGQGAHAEVFERSLPIAGVNGTARRLAARSPRSEAIGNVRVKTGSLRDVSAVAGYAWGHSGAMHVVVGLINHPNAPAARPALDRLLEWAVRDQ